MAEAKLVSAVVMLFEEVNIWQKKEDFLRVQWDSRRLKCLECRGCVSLCRKSLCIFLLQL